MRSSFAASLLGLLAGASAISQISTKGSKFFTGDGAQWFVKGVAYQLSESDPLVNTDQCQRDASLMKSLGANAIRVYHVDPNGDHDGCMSAFSDAGIYAFIDLDTFNTQIYQGSAHWNRTQEAAFEKVMDAFHQYDNVAGFFIGNEVLTDGDHSEVAVLVKAATRDLKNYRDSKGYRAIPVGYSHADIASLRPNLQNYLACGNNGTESVDFFGLNTYEWCGPHTYENSGYETITDQIKDYPVPIFLSETGCQTPRPRTFQDQTAIFGPQMAPYWSGAIVYEWIQESNDYGLVTYGDNTDAAVTLSADAVVRSGSPTPLSPDFSHLKSVWATVSPSSISKAAYNPSVMPPPCPALTSGTWLVNGDVSLPTVGASLDGSATASITAGTAAADAARTHAGASAKPTGTDQGGASPGREITGMSLGLMGVMAGFVWWL